MVWLLLGVAAVLEVLWAISLRYTEGYTQLWPSVASLVLVALNVYVLSLVFKGLPTSVAYPIWVGLGAAGTVLLSHVLFKDYVSAAHILFIACILIGVIGLKVLPST